MYTNVSQKIKRQRLHQQQDSPADSFLSLGFDGLLEKDPESGFAFGEAGKFERFFRRLQVQNVLIKVCHLDKERASEGGNCREQVKVISIVISIVACASTLASKTFTRTRIQTRT